MSDCVCDNEYNPEDYLYSLRIRPADDGIEIQYVQQDTIIGDERVSMDRLARFLGSLEHVDSFLEQSALRTSDSIEEGPPIQAQPDYYYPTFVWVKEYTEDFTHVWTNVAQLYSGRLLANHLTLKMSAGTRTVARVGWGGFTYGSAVTYEKEWITDLYAAPWQTFTIRMMMDYTYEYWQQYVVTGFGTFPAGNQRIWWCKNIRGGTLELFSPYPDIDRTKTYSEDSVSLEPGASKSVKYSQLVQTDFTFDVAVELKAQWAGGGGVVEFAVPLISFSTLSEHYGSDEAVYTLTSHANYYHIWDIYEYNSNYGTACGYVITFDIYE